MIGRMYVWCHIQNEHVVYLTIRVCPSGNFMQDPHSISNILEIWESLFTGLDYWIALLDWTTRLTQNGAKFLFQRRREANHVKFAPLAVEATLLESVGVKGHVLI